MMRFRNAIATDLYEKSNQKKSSNKVKKIARACKYKGSSGFIMFNRTIYSIPVICLLQGYAYLGTGGNKFAVWLVSSHAPVFQR